jgi:hypothetical protein
MVIYFYRLDNQSSSPPAEAPGFFDWEDEPYDSDAGESPDY